MVGSFILCGFSINFVGWHPIYIHTYDSGEENVWTSSCDGYIPLLWFYKAEIREGIDAM